MSLTLTPSSIGIQTAVLTADFPKTDDTLTVVPDLTLDLEAGRWYRITAEMYWYADVGVGAAIRWATSSTSTFDAIVSKGWVTSLLTDVTTPAAPLFQMVDGILNQYLGGGDDLGVATSTWIAKVDTGGTLEVAFAQNVTNASESLLIAGAALTVLDITPA